MKIIHSIAELRECLAAYERPAFVPTMGNLHEGHLALVHEAKPRGDVTVVSIFVNRLQFLPHEDFDSYPRTWESDVARLETAGCDVLFAPDEAELYPEAQTFKVHPTPDLANVLEGHFRPGFFIGVCTVVSKLFNCVFGQASGGGVAVFGKKDYQQLMVIKAMVRQMAMNIEIVGLDTKRADDGLALSSRNGYLSETERTNAVFLSRTLKDVADKVRSGDLEFAALEDRATKLLIDNGWEPDYVAIRRRDSLQAAVDGAPLVVLAAAKVGKTRLIDNLEI